MKTFPLQFDENTHRQIKHAAVDAGITLHEWILRAINDKLENSAYEPNTVMERLDEGRQYRTTRKMKEP